MLTDYFPPSRRGVAIGIFTLGIPFGMCFGVAAGSFIASMHGWRMAFYILGGFGILSSVLLFAIVREPPRTQSEEVLAAEAKPSMTSTWGIMLATPSLRNMVFGASVAALIQYTLLAWPPAYLMRVHSATLQDLGIFYSIVVGLSVGPARFWADWRSTVC